MSKPRDNRTITERLADDGLIQRALARAARAAMLDHKRTGDPIVTWQDGKVVWIPAEEIVVPEIEDEPEV